ncbi:uncharacterized protein LOC134537227 [Bacillus rossius redtenbacheri]|uniref:uncharacterized protein LOC134537227 n=1 Tax=Bacillus rossius redtenbacheri TaxID=93214 RepID=UPI002FDDEDA6
MERCNARNLILSAAREPRHHRVQEGLVVEALTHRYKHPDPSGTRVLARWPVAAQVQRHAWDMFPDKLVDLGGRPLTVAAIDYLPYSVMEFSGQQGVDDGTEFRLLRELARKLNCTWRKELDPDNLWGEVEEDGTGNGIAGLVSEDRAEIGFSAMYLWHSVYRFVDFTYPHAVTGVTCLVPRPRLLPAWRVPVLPLSGQSWAGVVASLAVTAVALHGVAKATDECLGIATPGRFNTFTDCALRTVGLLVLQIPREDFRNFPIRHLTLWLGFMYLLISSSYNAGLSSVLTLPRYAPPVDTVPDLARSGTLWVANHEAWVTSIVDAEDPDLQTVAGNFRVFNDSILEQKSDESQVAFSIERLYGGNFAVGDYIRPAAVGRYRLMGQDLYRTYCTTVVRKGSPYARRWNRLVLAVLGAGLWRHWEGEVARRFMSHQVQLAVATSARRASEGPRRLRPEHVGGALLFLALGLALSSLCLLLELLYHCVPPLLARGSKSPPRSAIHIKSSHISHLGGSRKNRR